MASSKERISFLVMKNRLPYEKKGFFMRKDGFIQRKDDLPLRKDGLPCEEIKSFPHEKGWASL